MTSSKTLRACTIEELTAGEKLATEVTLQLLSGKDPIQFVRFRTGGGVLTYLKGEDCHVHTLNTESGLLRKVDALGLGDRAYPVRRHASFADQLGQAILAILPFLHDDEKNASASILVRRFKHLTR